MFWSDLKILCGLATDTEMTRQMVEACEGLIQKEDWSSAIFGFKEALKYEAHRAAYEKRCYVGLLQAYYNTGEHKKAAEYAHLL
jgi:outer membrane protein assembly factor BamD (BamD/ComL family)